MLDLIGGFNYMIHTSLCTGAFHNWIFSIAFCDCHQFDGPCLKGQLHFDPHSRVVSSITLLSSHGTMESGTDDVLRWNIRYAKMNCSLCIDILLRCYSIMFNIFQIHCQPYGLRRLGCLLLGSGS